MANPILFFCSIALCFFSCKKDETTHDKKEDKLMLLTSKRWKPSRIDKNSATNPPGVINYSPTLNCELDDYYQFSTSNQLTITRGQDKCDANESNPAVLDYTIDADLKKITINGTVYTVAEISESQFKYYVILPSVTGFNAKVYMFEH